MKRKRKIQKEEIPERPLAKAPFLLMNPSIMPEMGDFLRRIFTSKDSHAAIAKEEEEYLKNYGNVIYPKPEVKE